MAFETISEKPFSKQELLNRKLHLANAKLNTSADLSNLFALFSILATVDLNINPGDASPNLLIVYIINTSILVVSTVLVKIAIMYITPRLETALFMSRYDINELDQILHEDVIKYLETIWIFSSLGSPFLFGVNFIFMIWIKFKSVSIKSVTAATAIMTPIVVLTMAFAIFSYLRIRKRNQKSLLNVEEIDSGSPKVHYSKRIQTNNNNSHVENRWGIVRAHVYRNGKSHVV